jgi:adenosylhomocysteine nucleosidase
VAGPTAGVLVVAALDEEVARVAAGFEVLVTGVGKAAAATALARRLSRPPQPRLVVNVGTAGAVDPSVRGVVEVGYITQHDFPYAAIEALVDRRLDRGYALAPDTPPMGTDAPPPDVVVLATGDTFVADPALASAIVARGVHVVDMEGFGYAAACAEFGVPMRCIKAVSDLADADAGLDWLDAVDGCARGIAEWLHANLGSG